MALCGEVQAGFVASKRVLLAVVSGFPVAGPGRAATATVTTDDIRTRFLRELRAS
jgi:hypothetical protein